MSRLLNARRQFSYRLKPGKRGTLETESHVYRKWQPKRKTQPKKKQQKTLVPIGGQGNPQRQSYTQQQVCNEHLRSILLVGRDKP